MAESCFRLKRKFQLKKLFFGMNRRFYMAVKDPGGQISTKNHFSMNPH